MRRALFYVIVLCLLCTKALGQHADSVVNRHGSDSVTFDLFYLCGTIFKTIEYCPTGKIKSESYYCESGKRLCQEITRYLNGNMKSNYVITGNDTCYNSDSILLIKQSGYFLDYYENGQLKSAGSMYKCAKLGQWVYYKPDGKVESIEMYNGDVTVEKR